MATILKEKAIWFNDVILVPQLGKVKSRSEIPKEYHRIIVSPMTSVCGPTFAKEANRLGLTVCIPRFLGVEKEAGIYSECGIKDNLYCSIGLKDEERIKEFSRLGCTNYLIDIANGYMPHIEDTVKLLLKRSKVDNLILGNITTAEGYIHLQDIFYKNYLNGIIRCGISNGSGCATYDATGYGSGQVSELLEINKVKKMVGICSDGGHKNGGTIMKAFGAGADYVMVGGVFAESFEAETHISGDGEYFGLASHKNQIISTGKKYRHSEGKCYAVNKDNLKPLKDIVEELWGGISSGVSYSGFKSLSEFIGNGIFQIKENSLPPKIRK